MLVYEEKEKKNKKTNAVEWLESGISSSVGFF